jgi:putative DNA primase/helicase
LAARRCGSGEGEKDCDRLWAAGLPATTNIGGAGKWGPGETNSLKLAGVQHVIILPDNDEPGRKHATQVATALRSAGLGVQVIHLPNLPPNGDVSDWLDVGGDVRQNGVGVYRRDNPPQALMRRLCTLRSR